MVINGLVHLDVTTIEEGYSFERLRSGLARRVKAVPPFRRKVHDSPWNPGHPAWVEDFDFDITHHLRRIELGPAGTEVGDVWFPRGAAFRSQIFERERTGYAFAVHDDVDKQVVYAAQHTGETSTGPPRPPSRGRTPPRSTRAFPGRRQVSDPGCKGCWW